jgi:hypothetical protein
MSKYDRLGEHLSGLDRETTHTLSFDRIEGILGFRLPKSAREYQAWWANQTGGGHVQSEAWVANGWHSEQLSLAGKHVTFKAVDAVPRSKATRQRTGRGLSISEAKQAVALHYGVHADRVEISVTG